MTNQHSLVELAFNNQKGGASEQDGTGRMLNAVRLMMKIQEQ
jgi:hypothetical protein